MAPTSAARKAVAATRVGEADSDAAPRPSHYADGAISILTIAMVSRESHV